MSPAIDFSAVKDLEPIPAGKYEAEIVHAAEGMSKTGNPKIDLRWKILAGEYEGRQVFDLLAFAPNALFRVKATLKALGWDVNKPGAQTISGADLIGLQATIVVSIEPSSGADPQTGEPYPERNRVVKVLTLGTDVNALFE
jgi:hypothetical protein